MKPRDRTPRARQGDVLVGRYRIVDLIAQGGVADVFRARDRLGGLQVAIKLLRSVTDPNEVDYKRFQLEAQLLQKLEHPNVARTLHHGITARGVPFMVLELIDGMNLKDLLRERGPLGVRRTSSIARQVLLALESAHAQNIIHRDVKPNNILLTRELQVKLIDFGLAKKVGSKTPGAKLTEKGMAVGTPRYMAPEQVRGLELGKTVDLYPFGLVIAEMLSGEPLVTGRHPVEIIRIHAAREPLELPDSVSSSVLAPIIRRAVGKTLGERYRSAKQMRNALDAVCPPTD